MVKQLKILEKDKIILVDNKENAKKLSSKPNFERVTVFDNNLSAFHMQKTEVYFNKLKHVGQAILDLSKTLMFDFHYNYIKPKYSKKAEVLFTDTDSLMCEIKTADFSKDIAKDINKKFDTSDIPPDHPSGIKTGINKKVIGMFKDEAAGYQITHFVSLRPKLYSYKIEDRNEETKEKKCKGNKKNVTEKGIKFEDYINCLNNETEEMRTMNIIRSKDHTIYSMKINKIALLANDDKRIICKNKINTLALR